MATVTRENVGLLTDKLTVKLSKEDYFPTFEKTLKEYSKKASIPGFRKGMVPTGMIKKMYGPSLYTEEILKTAEKELFNYLNNEKPEIFAQPLPLDADIRSMDVNNPADYEFGFEIGLKPAFEIAPLAKAKLTLHTVKTTDAMVELEITRMLEKAGKTVDVETVDNQENVLDISFSETDKAGNGIEGGTEKAEPVLLKSFTASAQAQLMGKKKDDTIVVQLSKSFEGDQLATVLGFLGYEKDDKDAAKKYFKLTIANIGLIERRALDESFFNDVFPNAGITTEEAFKTKLKEELTQLWLGESQRQLNDQVYHYLLDGTKMEFPETFLKRWLQNGGEKQKTAEEVEAEFPGFSHQLKWTLISDKIIKDNKLEVGQQELKDSIKAEVTRYFGSMNLGEDTSWLDSYVDRMMKDEKQVESSYHRLITEKLFTWAQGQIKPTEKETTPEELSAMQHNHHH